MKLFDTVIAVEERLMVWCDVRIGKFYPKICSLYRNGLVIEGVNVE